MISEQPKFEIFVHFEMSTILSTPRNILGLQEFALEWCEFVMHLQWWTCARPCIELSDDVRNSQAMNIELQQQHTTRFTNKSLIITIRSSMNIHFVLFFNIGPMSYDVISMLFGQLMSCLSASLLIMKFINSVWMLIYVLAREFQS